MPYRGGVRILTAELASDRAVLVTFESEYNETYHTQLYAGRSLAGVTTEPGDRQILAEVFPSESPQHLQLLAVPIGERTVNYGSDLPHRPYNRVRVRFTPADWGDVASIEIAASTEPGGAVDAENIIWREPFDSAGQREIILDPLNGAGVWAFEVAGRDRAGNRGDPLSLSAAVLSYPPDLESDGDGRRLTASVTGGVLTVGFNYSE